MDNPAKILELTSQCVMCAACMPTCPTYQATQDENFSPRGRISLVKAVTQNKITLSDKVISHFDSCLQCLNCQTICPSQVNYAEIITYAMKQSYFHKKVRWYSLSFISEQISNLVLVNRSFRKYFIAAVNFLIRSNIMRIFKRLALKYNFKNISLLPDRLIKSAGRLSKQNFSDRIAIFNGCATSLFDSPLLLQVCELFELLQVAVIHIDTENCCGAIYQKQGNIKALGRLETRSINTQIASYPIISINSACSAHINKSAAYKKYDVDDIVTILVNKFWERLNKIQFSSFANNVFYHQSCSMRNTLKSQGDCFKLLKLIPDINIVTYPQISCCGAAGNYMLSHASLAEKIVQPYITFIIKENIHFMISTDISCSLHIKQQLEKQNYHIEVLHPVSLLHQQII